MKVSRRRRGWVRWTPSTFWFSRAAPPHPPTPHTHLTMLLRQTLLATRPPAAATSTSLRRTQPARPSPFRPPMATSSSPGDPSPSSPPLPMPVEAACDLLGVSELTPFDEVVLARDKRLFEAGLAKDVAAHDKVRRGGSSACKLLSAGCCGPHSTRPGGARINAPAWRGRIACSALVGERA